MAKPELSELVIQKLLDTMHAVVTDFDSEVRRPPSKASDLIQGTAFFPGGTGLWRGDKPGGKLPEYFPLDSVMLVGHNFDSITAFERSLKRGGECEGQFWKKMLGMLGSAGLSPERCFFTNALMGFKPGSATGKMPGDKRYRDQCLSFLRKQIDIVQPKAVVALGNDAQDLLLRLGVPFTKIVHPSARWFGPKATRETRLQAEGQKVQEFLSRTLTF